MNVLTVAGILICVSAVLGIGGYWCARKRIPKEIRQTGTKSLWYLGYWPGNWKRKVVRLLHLEDAEAQYYKKLYVNEQPGTKRMENDCKCGTAILAILAGLGVALLLAMRLGAFSEMKLHELQRPESGIGITRLKAKYEGQEYELSVSVSERRLSAEEIRKSLEHAEDDLLKAMLGNNKSADEITEALVFPATVPGTSIGVTWNTSDYRIVDYTGAIFPEECEKNGNIVVITATLLLGEEDRWFQYPVRVLPKSGSEIGQAESVLQKTLYDCEEKQAYEPSVTLPKTIGEETVEFYRERRLSPEIFAVYAGLLLIVVFVLLILRMKQDSKERERQLLRDYPDLVSKLSLLLEAGMTPRFAWKRIVTDYLSHRKDGIRYAYEEMLHTENHLNSGISEETAYEEFGKRCGNIRYLRFSSMLVQNLKMGSSGIFPILRREAAEAFCDRKEQAKQKGEEAGTKLLVPMAGILVIILAMILIPAFMTL